LKKYNSQANNYLHQYQGLFTSFGKGALALFMGKKCTVFILLGKKIIFSNGSSTIITINKDLFKSFIWGKYHNIFAYFPPNTLILGAFCPTYVTGIF
jgi:hypothetical protein